MTTDSIDDIRARWQPMPPLRIAKGLDDACNDWPLGEFGEHPTEGHAVWLATDHVHCSEMMLTSVDVAEVLAEAPKDVQALFARIAELEAALEVSQLFADDAHQQLRAANRRIQELHHEHARDISDAVAEACHREINP